MIVILGLVLIGFYILSKKSVAPVPTPVEQASAVPSAFTVPTVSVLPEVEKISKSFFETPIFSKTLNQIQDVVRKVVSGSYISPVAQTAEVAGVGGYLGGVMGSAAVTAGMSGQAQYSQPYSSILESLNIFAGIGTVLGGFLEGIIGTHETPLSSFEEVSLYYAAILDRIDKEIISKYGGSLDLSFVKARSNPFNYQDIYNPSWGGGRGIPIDIREQSWGYTMAWRALTYTRNTEVRDGMLIEYDPLYGQGGPEWIPQVYDLIREQVLKAGGYIELMNPMERAFYEYMYKPCFADVVEGTGVTRYMMEYNIQHP